MPNLAIFSHENMVFHETGPGHPEQPDRLKAIIEAIRLAELAGIDWFEAEPIRREFLELVHKPDYLDMIDSLDGKSALLDDDTVVSPKSVAAARLAAGAAVAATEHVLAGKSKTAYALLRPPGHHAETARAMGFCLYNNVAVAAAVALAKHNLERVLVIDWDVHHGNGTQEIFYERNDVLFMSLQQFPHWPGTGSVHELGDAKGEGYTLNFPLPAGTGNDVYLGVFANVIAPIARLYRPQLILISAGFDAHEDDPLGDMLVTPEGFEGMCAIMRNLADELCDSRLVLVQEGGYGLRGLAASALACVRVLNHDALPEPETPLPISSGPEVMQFAEHFKPYWPI